MPFQKENEIQEEHGRRQSRLEEEYARKKDDAKNKPLSEGGVKQNGQSSAGVTTPDSPADDADEEADQQPESESQPPQEMRCNESQSVSNLEDVNQCSQPESIPAPEGRMSPAVGESTSHESVRESEESAHSNSQPVNQELTTSVTSQRESDNHNTDNYAADNQSQSMPEQTSENNDLTRITKM